MQTNTPNETEAIVKESNRRLSNLEHCVLEAGEADAYLNWLRTTLTQLNANRTAEMEELQKKYENVLKLLNDIDEGKY